MIFPKMYFYSLIHSDVFLVETFHINALITFGELSFNFVSKILLLS